MDMADIGRRSEEEDLDPPEAQVVEGLLQASSAIRLEILLDGVL